MREKVRNDGSRCPSSGMRYVEAFGLAQGCDRFSALDFSPTGRLSMPKRVFWESSSRGLFLKFWHPLRCRQNVRRETSAPVRSQIALGYARRGAQFVIQRYVPVQSSSCSRGSSGTVSQRAMCVHCVCILCVYSVCTFCVYIPCVRSVCAFCVCILCVHSVCAFCVCALCVHSVCAFCVCILCVRSVCAFCVCILCVHSVCAFCVCILCVHSVCTSCVCILCRSVTITAGPHLFQATKHLRTGTC